MIRILKTYHWLFSNRREWLLLPIRSLLFTNICGLYYKTITIVIMTIVSDAPNCAVTYDCNWRHQLRLGSTLAKARVINYDRNSSFIILGTVITIVNYDRKTFIIQATDSAIFFLGNQPIYRVDSATTKYVSKYLNINKRGAKLRLFFWLALPAEGFSVRIRLFG